MPEATKLFGVFGFLCVQDDGRNQTMGWCLFFKSDHQTSGVVFKYLVFCWKAGTSHMFLERNSNTRIWWELKILIWLSIIYPYHTDRDTLATDLFFNCDFGLFYEAVCFAWEDVQTKTLTEQSTERCGVLSTLAAVAFGASLCQSCFHYTAWPKHSSSAMYRQLFVRTSAFVFPKWCTFTRNRTELAQPLRDACFNTKFHVSIWTSVFKRSARGGQISLMLSLSSWFSSLSEVKRRGHQNANVLCWEGSGMNSSSTGLYVKFLSTISKIYSLKTIQYSWNTCLLI